MKNPRTLALHDVGQRLWLDNITRQLLRSVGGPDFQINPTVIDDRAELLPQSFLDHGPPRHPREPDAIVQHRKPTARHVDDHIACVAQLVMKTHSDDPAGHRRCASRIEYLVASQPAAQGLRCAS